MKNTGTQYLRRGNAPNQREQDGLKDLLFCSDCEALLSTNEKWFSENIFHPFLSNNHQVFIYDEHLSKFVVSILWRMALILKVDSSHHKPIIIAKIEEALEEWRNYILSDKEPLKYNEIHLFLVPDEWGAPQPNSYITRYFTRVVDGSIIDIDDDEVWIYVKFARFMFFGRVSGRKKVFRNTKIDFKSNVTSLGQYIDSTEMSGYLMVRAEKIYDHFRKNISSNQMKVIQDFTIQNFEKITKSDLGKRMMQDYSATVDPTQLVVSFNYMCDCCSKEMSEPEGYLLRTFEILLSKKYFTEYFERYDLTTSDEDLKVRVEIFKTVADLNGPWVICESCSEKFSFNRVEAKEFMIEWIENKGDYSPPKSENFRDHLSEDQIREIGYNIVTI